MNKEEFNRSLLHWYQLHSRDLPWREVQDPYRIWISEVMLQQTRVDTVIPYYRAWMLAFPDLESLNEAAEQDIMKAWEGLGYYSRARNIIKAAHILCSKYAGKFPQTAAELKKLPGVGDYIACALASIAFGQNEVALDGNGLRVFSRLLEFGGSIDEVKQKSVLKQKIETILPSGCASQFNQAVMDLGSSICVPTMPDCEHCPVQSECLAFLHSAQEKFPVRRSGKSVPHHDVVAAVIRKGHTVLIDKRKADGLLGGLWEFPGGKVEEKESRPDALIREIREELGVDIRVLNEMGKYNHAYTHFKVTVFVYAASIITGKPTALAADEIRWIPVSDLSAYPMGKVDRLISESLK